MESVQGIFKSKESNVEKVKDMEQLLSDSMGLSLRFRHNVSFYRIEREAQGETNQQAKDELIKSRMLWIKMKEFGPEFFELVKQKMKSVLSIDSGGFYSYLQIYQTLDDE
ncbi:MAG: hypothetical protein HY226_06390, partial [Candidatus Vogelbacteria bacterium]|nr:hypothetical protein [Candidatus Vogelbacteria bacterium]